ncbi:hypothetical protein CD134_02290 [Staphylococcus lutrae]|uniref:Uncharacterized protein n=1 Tax=Staphylococcus lutrae TaxID=155085 RepID=A0AAC9RQY6_9STAP|nr:hypothetical protein B5P37_04715 [Staphylococcus lutrae]PNZ39112.1 hypothetical protein CD134_02290 [Staphylococcus lutrae]
MLETIISRELTAIHPRDHYALFTLYSSSKFDVLRIALDKTVEKRGSQKFIYIWENQLVGIESSDYQKRLWIRYKKPFKCVHFSRDCPRNHGYHHVKQKRLTLIWK